MTDSSRRQTERAARTNYSLENEAADLLQQGRSGGRPSWTRYLALAEADADAAGQLLQGLGVAASYLALAGFLGHEPAQRVVAPWFPKGGTLIFGSEVLSVLHSGLMEHRDLVSAGLGLCDVVVNDPGWDALCARAMILSRRWLAGERETLAGECRSLAHELQETSEAVDEGRASGDLGLMQIAISLAQAVYEPETPRVASIGFTLHNGSKRCPSEAARQRSVVLQVLLGFA